MSSAGKKSKQTTYGLMAEFVSAEKLVEAARKTRTAGYRKVDAYTPFPVEALSEALALGENRLPLLVLIAGILGGLGGFFMQYYISVIAYPVVAGGKPLNSWPAFIPVTFEMTILAAAAAGVFGMIGMNRLPMPYHPVFAAKNFERATLDRFFLCISSEDERYHPERTRRFLSELKPENVEELLP